MKMVIQRVSHASVTVNMEKIGSIQQGFLILLGISQEDTQEIADKMIRKLLGLRIFSDENGKTNLSLKDVNGSLLIVSQFTLYADCKKGNRPSFIEAAKPAVSQPLYDDFNAALGRYVPVQTGVFGADMKIALINDGPVTIVLDSKEMFA